MALTKERVAELVAQYGRKEGDTGSPEVQIAVLTEQINILTSMVARNSSTCSAGTNA